MICSTSASRWKFQYFQRPIYNPVECLWLSLYCKNSKSFSIFTKKLIFLHHSIIFLKPIRIFWSNFYQLHVLMLTLPTHDIMILGGMNGKLASENFFWKWISRERRKWWNDCSKLALIAIELEQIVNMLTISMKNAIVSNLTIVAFQFFVMNSFTSYV